MATGTIHKSEKYVNITNSWNLDGMDYASDSIYWWYGAPQHAPENVSNAYMRVMHNPNSGRTVQIIYHYNSMYIREKYGDSWEPWYKFAGVVVS